MLRNNVLILVGKTLSLLSTSLNLGNGSTWPGHLALQINPHFIQKTLKNAGVKVILVAGTNGKTTTASLIKIILQTAGKKVIHNTSGANLLNGIASTLVLESNKFGKIEADYAIFEVDENAFPRVLEEIDPYAIILLNLFRDQLDRYGEVASIAAKWKDALKNEEHVQLFLNADDPQISFIGQQLFHQKHVKYFGLNQKGKKVFEHAADSLYCPRCGTKLHYTTIYYSHLGDWSCPHCKLKRPQLSLETVPSHPLAGLYNTYNTLAATLLTKELGIPETMIIQGLQRFTPAFGRQEKIIYKEKSVQLFLVKNPAGFNETLRTIQELGAKHLLIALNDGIADGTDVSWIWDVDTPLLHSFAKHITITGTRVYDMGLRIKYSELSSSSIQTVQQIEKAVETSIQCLPSNETLFVLPTYTAMLAIRKILSGKKIL